MSLDFISGKNQTEFIKFPGKTKKERLFKSFLPMPPTFVSKILRIADSKRTIRYTLTILLTPGRFPALLPDSRIFLRFYRPAALSPAPDQDPALVRSL